MDDRISFESLFRELNEFHIKFEYYFLGIIIALLSLSIQSFNPDETTRGIFLMFIMWGLLVISLFCGFYRLEKFIMFKSIEVDKAFKIQYEHYDSNSKLIKAFNLKINELNKKLAFYYSVQKWAFVVAILSFLAFKIFNFINFKLY